ncbi:MAG: UDP-N-acetylmuramate dehydrogenase [Candidatus Gracilibacteria bacterium]|nr:UDP-N-acetylmuramate dehydrogenase [Candidatus Gracilibacteria bacterium]
MKKLNYLKTDVDITNLSNFKTKAKTKFYYEINTENDLDNLKEIYQFCKTNNLDYLFIGGGTNMLFAFDLYEGVIIKNNLRGWNYDKSSQILHTFSDEWISDIATSLEKDYNQGLWHRFIGLPGSVGGAIYGNAGCFGLETENNFLDASVYDLQTGQIIILSKIDMLFNYRSSIIKDAKNRYFIIKARFDLSKKIEKYSSEVDNIDFRENKQPKGNTCGSFFKNPDKDNSAGYLIEQVGFKGYKLGGAFFSPLHANFLMHDGKGTYKDLLNLIELTIKKVKDEKQIELIPEVRIIFNQN